MTINHKLKRLFFHMEFTEVDLPKHGEVWEKLPHPGLCRVGWSLGAGIHRVDTYTTNDWGTVHQLNCGCLRKVKRYGRGV